MNYGGFLGSGSSSDAARSLWSRVCWLVCLFQLLAAPGLAGSKLDTSDPLGFFTNLSSRLLQSELELSLTRIQVWPTNQYTPAVHRLLQVSANILDATTNRFNNTYPYLPSVFRPRFTNDGGSIFICGYEEPGPHPLTNTWRDLSFSADRDALQAGDLVHGIPIVIGAKKGFPNFNEFAMQSVFQITRRLQLTRPSVSAPRSTWQTNQMFLMGISNIVGVELWHSYRSNYPRAMRIVVENNVTMQLTNDVGFVMTTSVNLSASLSVPSNGWTGYHAFVPDPSFHIPLMTNVVFLPEAAYQSDPPGFTTNWQLAWDTSQTFPQPRWGLAITNRLRLFMVDHETQRLVDFVTLPTLNGIRDLSEEIRDPDDALGFNGLWSTNRWNGTVPSGILNQIEISQGNYGGYTADWTGYGLGQPSGTAKEYEIDRFRVFCGLTPLQQWPGGIPNTNLVQSVPFTPTKRVSQYLTWQAADPLVHQLPEHLAVLGGIQHESLKLPLQPVKNIGRINNRYQPWGGNPHQAADPNRFAIALKDPLIGDSDDWTFQATEPLSLSLLGRVHRGTPWQTVYLKSARVSLSEWQTWSGISDDSIARQTMPTNDWRLAALFASLLNTNPPHQLLSVNERDTNVWLRVLDGLLVLTNTSTDAELNRLLPLQQFDELTISSNSPQAAIMAEAVAQARVMQPGHYFAGLGDMLAAPELSTASPWLNQSTAVQWQKGITDEAYERIPSQLLARLRPDSVVTFRQSGEVLRMQFTGLDDFPYTVEGSTDLVNWAGVSTNYPTNGVFEVAVPFSTESPQSFYRSALLP